MKKSILLDFFFFLFVLYFCCDAYMEKIKIKFDYVSYYDFEEEFLLYLSKSYGIISADVDKKTDDIILEYDSSKISLELLTKEILIYLGLDKIPSVIAFDKCVSNSHIRKDIIVIKDICCEYCLKDMIKELLVVDGIESAYTDFDYVNKYNVNIFITYDDTIINEEKLIDLKNKFNG